MKRNLRTHLVLGAALIVGAGFLFVSRASAESSFSLNDAEFIPVAVQASRVANYQADALGLELAPVELSVIKSILEERQVEAEDIDEVLEQVQNYTAPAQIENQDEEIEAGGAEDVFEESNRTEAESEEPGNSGNEGNNGNGNGNGNGNEGNNGNGNGNGNGNEGNNGNGNGNGNGNEGNNGNGNGNGNGNEGNNGNGNGNGNEGNNGNGNGNGNGNEGNNGNGNGKNQ